MKIALASCSNLPGWEIDDLPLHEALQARGVQFEKPEWNDPNVDWTEFDACVIRTTWDYWNARDAFVQWAHDVGEKIPFFNPPEVISWNTHKSYLRELEDRGVQIAPTQWYGIGESADVKAVMESHGWTRGFLKPVVGASAFETLRFNLDEEGLASAGAHLDRTLKTHEMMLQPYLAAVETFGEVSFLFFGGAFSHAVQKVPVNGDYRVQDDFGASDGPYAATESEIAMAARTIAAAEDACPGIGAGDLLYARVDYLKDDAGEWVLTELELVEPSLFFRHAPKGGERMVEALLARLAK